MGRFMLLKEAHDVLCLQPIRCAKKAVHLSLDLEPLNLGKGLGLSLLPIAEEALARAVK